MYHLVSSVTGQKITDVQIGLNAGQAVYLGGTKIAFDTNYENADYRTFTLTDPISGSTAPMGSDGTVYLSSRTELGALGTSVPLFEPPAFPPMLDFENGYAGDSEYGCRDEFGDPEPCSFARISAHYDAVQLAKGRRLAKEALGLLNVRQLPQLPFHDIPRGPSTGLAASYADPSAFEMPDIRIPEETVTVNISDPFEGMSAEFGMPSPLTAKEHAKLDKNIIKIKKKLEKEKCKDFLESHGISRSDLLGQLDDQSLRFSGPRSTDITVEEAGLLGENARETIEALDPVTEKQARDSSLAVLGWSVSKWFKNNGGLNGTVRAAVGTGRRVFYRSFGMTTTLHENLHVSTKLKDIPLADKLGLRHSGTTESASEAISKALKARGCS